MPEMKDNIEKASVIGNRTFRLDPIESEMELNTQPEIAQVTAKMETIIPIWALDNFKSGPMNGNR
jgi:hypothetical protein